jgi:site-specific DNA-methyltransferase (adenine-specific)
VLLFNGDCLEVMKTLEPGSIDLVLTDPPYGTTACKWDSVIPFEPMWAELKRVRKPNAAIVLFGSEPFSSNLRMSNIKEFKYDWIWDKKFAGNFVTAKIMPMKTNELISVFGSKINYRPQMITRDHPIRSTSGSTLTTLSKIKPLEAGQYNVKFPVTILHFPRILGKSKEKVGHPTQKPVALLEYLIKTYTLEGDTVLDFTMGSGSTGVACKNLNRKFIGIEKDEKYFVIAKQRIENADATQSLQLFNV